MFRMSPYRLPAAAAILALLGLAQPQAGAAPAQTQVVLTDLTYHISDLDITDARAPSLVFLASSTFNVLAKTSGDATDAARYRDAGLLSGTSFDDSSASIGLDNGLGSASKQGRVQQTSTSLSVAALDQAGVDGPGPVVGYCGDPYGCQAFSQVKSSNSFILGAHTKVQITGVLQGSASIDASQAVTSTYLATHPDKAMTLRALTGLRISATRDGGYRLNNWAWSQSAEQTFFNDGSAPTGQADAILDQLVHLEIANETDRPMDVLLSMLTYGHSTVFTSPVPEPSRWALTALGMAGVAWVAAGRKRSS